MGQRIVRELGLEDSNDTLGRWMAHRIAELIERAEQASEDSEAQEEARRECADLILRVWSRRSGWPYGQPLAKLAAALEKLVAKPNPYDRRSQEPKEQSWTGVFPLLDKIHQRERQVHRDAALAEHSPEESKSWLEEHEDDMAEEETDTLRRLVQMIERTRNEHFYLIDKPSPRFGTLSKEERAKLTLEALNEIDNERQSLRELASSTEKSVAAEESDNPSAE